MRLPRWLVLALLSTNTASVLAAGAWWWVTWPERTAHKFAALVATRRTEEAAKMMRSASGPDDAELITDATKDCEFTFLEYGSRTPVDMLVGRQEFQVVGTYTPTAFGLCCCGGSIAPEAFEPLGPRSTAIRFTTLRGIATRPFGFISGKYITVLDEKLHLESVNSNWASYRVPIERR
jgi:hypothetical protein